MQGRPAKKQRTEAPSPDQLKGMTVDVSESFVLPRCHQCQGLFAGNNSLLIHEDEITLAPDREARGKELAQDAEVLVRMVSAALTLNDAKAFPLKDLEWL